MTTSARVGGVKDESDVPPCPMVPFCGVVRRAAAAMESVEDRGWPAHHRHRRDQCEVRDVGPSDPGDPPPPPSPPRTAGRRVRLPRGSRVGFNFAILFSDSDDFDRPRLTERRAGLVRIWLAGVEDRCRLEDAHDAMEDVLTAVRAHHQVSGCGSFAIGWEVPVVMVPWPPGLDTATSVKQEREPLASDIAGSDAALSTSTGPAGIAEAETAAALALRQPPPRVSPPKKRQRILRRGTSTAAAGITGTDRPELSASAGPAGSTEAASSASSGPAGSTAAASSSAAPSAGPAGSTAAASTAAGITGSPTTSPATRHKILTSGGDGGNCGPRSASAGRTPAEASSTARAARRAT